MEVTTAIITPPHLIDFWGELNVVPTSMAAKLITMSWSVLGDIPKGPAEASKSIVNTNLLETLVKMS